MSKFGFSSRFSCGFSVFLALAAGAGMVGGMGAAIAGSPAEKLTAEQRAELAQYFGFGAMQIYKFKPSISNLRIADLNGDGRKDVCIWNGYQNRFEILYQPDDPKSTAVSRQPTERNDTPDRGTMRIDPLTVAYNVAAFEIADFNGDSASDIVFFGEPRELVILSGKKGGGFGPPAAIRAPDGAPRGAGLAVGDFNHDGRADAALLGDEYLLIYHQKPAGGLESPDRIVHTIAAPLIMLAADIDGDGRDDLALTADDEQYGAYVLLQEDSGRLGPIRRVKIPKLRSMTFAAAKTGADLYAIQAVSGRLMHYRWGPAPEAGDVEWPQQIHTYPTPTKAKRQPFAIGDLTNDGLADCITASADSAQLVLIEQGSNGLRPARSFPGLLKTNDISIADVDGDGKAELLSVSPEERLIGVSKMEAGRLGFPAPMTAKGKPYVATVGRLVEGDDDSRRLAYVAKDGDDFVLTVRATDDEAENAAVRVKTGTLKDDPAGVRFFDINQDGRNDVLLFVRFSPLIALLSDEKGEFAALSGAETRDGLVRDAPLDASVFADVDADGKPELILAQKSFARALRVQNGRWTVVEQFNPPRADAEVVGLAVDASNGPRPTVRLYDRKARELITLTPAEGNTYQPEAPMPIGAIEPIAMTMLPGGAGRPASILIADTNKIITLTPEKRPATFVEQTSYESDEKDAYLADGIIGDLNHDQVRDVAVLDMRKARIEILTQTGPDQLTRALRFSVFQGKRFSDDPDRSGEPREMQIADVTGDGQDDAVLIVHDRVLIYPGQ